MSTKLDELRKKHGIEMATLSMEGYLEAHMEMFRAEIEDAVEMKLGVTEEWELRRENAWRSLLGQPPLVSIRYEELHARCKRQQDTIAQKNEELEGLRGAVKDYFGAYSAAPGEVEWLGRVGAAKKRLQAMAARGVGAAEGRVDPAKPDSEKNERLSRLENLLIVAKHFMDTTGIEPPYSEVGMIVERTAAARKHLAQAMAACDGAAKDGVDPVRPGSEKTVLCYLGQDIETLTREELIEALRRAFRLFGKLEDRYGKDEEWSRCFWGFC